jgi:acetate kinase
LLSTSSFIASGANSGSLAAALGGLDALVFTAGIGEHAAKIRERVCLDAAWLGIQLDASANQAKAQAHQHLVKSPFPPGSFQPTRN